MTLSLSRTPRLSTLSRTTTIDGQEFLVEGFQDPFTAKARIFQAWVRLPRSEALSGNHHTITSRDVPEGGRDWFGQVGTERDSHLFGHLEGGSQARIDAVRAKCAARAAQARAAILAAFPELAGCEREGVLQQAHEINSSAQL